jgi:DNA-binding MarR family transcriptional regulator
MMVLWEKDGQSVSEIGERLYLDSATLTPLLKRLETAELVQRARSRADERQVEIRLTGQGKKLRKSAEAVPEAILCSTRCEPDQLLQLRNDLHSLRRRLASNDLAN